jgi:hypothetical protein
LASERALKNFTMRRNVPHKILRLFLKKVELLPTSNYYSLNHYEATNKDHRTIKVILKFQRFFRNRLYKKLQSLEETSNDSLSDKDEGMANQRHLSTEKNLAKVKDLVYEIEQAPKDRFGNFKCQETNSRMTTHFKD